MRIDRLVEGAYAATVEVAGPLGVRSVDARPSDALNLGAISSAPVLVSPEVVQDGERRQAGDSVEARLLRLAPAAPPMTITRQQA